MTCQTGEGIAKPHNTSNGKVWMIGESIPGRRRPDDGFWKRNRFYPFSYDMSRMILIQAVFLLLFLIKWKEEI